MSTTYIVQPIYMKREDAQDERGEWSYKNEKNTQSHKQNNNDIYKKATER